MEDYNASIYNDIDEVLDTLNRIVEYKDHNKAVECAESLSASIKLLHKALTQVIVGNNQNDYI